MNHFFLIIRTNANRSLYITYLPQSRINTMSNFHPFFIPFSKLNGTKCLTHKLQNFTGKFHITLEGVLICSDEYSGLEEDLERTFDHIQLCEKDRRLLRGVMLDSPPVTVVINNEEAAFVAAATAAAAADGEKCNSISKKQLLRVDALDKHHGEPMHVAQGMLTHMTAETYKLLKDIDGYDSTDGDEDEVDDTVTNLPSAAAAADDDIDEDAYEDEVDDTVTNLPSAAAADDDIDEDAYEDEDDDTVTDLPSANVQLDSDDDSYDEDQDLSQQVRFF